MINVTLACVLVIIKYYKDETKFKEINICGAIVKTHICMIQVMCVFRISQLRFSVCSFSV